MYSSPQNNAADDDDDLLIPTTSLNAGPFIEGNITQGTVLES